MSSTIANRAYDTCWVVPDDRRQVMENLDLNLDYLFNGFGFGLGLENLNGFGSGFGFYF